MIQLMYLEELFETERAARNTKTAVTMYETKEGYKHRKLYTFDGLDCVYTYLGMYLFRTSGIVRVEVLL